MSAPHPRARVHDAARARGGDAGRSEIGEGVYRDLVHGVVDVGIFAVDRDGTILTWNAGAERLFGYAADEIVGGHVSTLYPRQPATAGKAAEELAVAAEQGLLEAEGMRQRKDGHRFRARTSISAIRDDTDAVTGFGCAVRESPARAGTSQAFLPVDDRFRLIVDAVQDYAIFALDADGIVRTWNAGAQRLKGYQAHEIVGRHFSVFYPEEDLRNRKPWHELEEAAAKGRVEDEGWRVRRDGSTFWANVVITALRDEDGSLVGFGKVTRDLTDRRRTELDLRASEQRLGERTRALEAANAELESFGRSVSHDLRGPLRGIETLARAATQADGDDLRDLLARIQSEAHRAASLVDSLLELSRAGRGEMRVETVDLAALARQTVDGFATETPPTKFEIVGEPSAFVVRGDRELLRIVLDNLLGNAWKFTRRAPEPRVTFSAEPSKLPDGGPRQRAFTVRDNGVGFPSADASRLFAPFRRLHPATEFAGTGLGLASVKRIVERHGGSVRAVGAVGQGAAITFTLQDAS